MSKKIDTSTARVREIIRPMNYHVPNRDMRVVCSEEVGDCGGLELSEDWDLTEEIVGMLEALAAERDMLQLALREAMLRADAPKNPNEQDPGVNQVD